MSTQSDFSLPPYPNEPLILQQKQANAAETAPSLWSLLALIGPNYIGQPVKSTNRAKVVRNRFYHLPERIVDEPFQLPSPTSGFIDSYTVPVVIPEMWLAVLELPYGARLVVRIATKSKYEQLKENPDQPVSVDYKIGRFDGVPKLKPTGRFLQPPARRHIAS